METAEIKKIIEALLFASDQPLNENNFKFILGDISKDINIEQLVNEIGEDYTQRNSPVELLFIAGGWQFATKKEFGSWVRRLYKEKVMFKLSNASLETLSVIAYKQPITRGEVEEIRGVETGYVIDTLLERKLIRIVGRKETLGRPILYGTTLEFLKHFGLSHLSELPSLEDLVPPQEPVLETSLETPKDETPQELPFEEKVLEPAAVGTATEENTEGQ